MKRLEGKVAIVTGASQGIGYAIAKAFAREGASVAINARREETLGQVAAEIEAAGGKVVAVAGDVSQRDTADRTIKAATDAWGRIDVLVNNAQVTRNCALEEVDDELIELTFGSGFRGTLYHMQAAYPWLKKQGGSIVNFGTRQGIYGQPYDGVYGANKEAIRALTRTAAREWGSHLIRVNVINPAGLSPAAAAFLEADAERAQKYYDEMPLGRFGRLDEDIAPIAVFLASDDSHYVTGQTINADGGQIML